MNQAANIVLTIEAIYFSETSVDFHWIQGVISQKTELFITTVVRTSNPTKV
jgi:hypothetical protein